MCKVCHQNIGIPNIINLYVFLFLLKVSIIFSLFLFLLLRSSKIPKVHFTISFFTLIVLCWAVIINGHTLLSVALLNQSTLSSHTCLPLFGIVPYRDLVLIYMHIESPEKRLRFFHIYCMDLVGSCFLVF